jgi:hypothetical protein
VAVTAFLLQHAVQGWCPPVATVLMSRPKLGQAALLIVLRPRPLLNLLPLDLVPGLKVGDSRQEPLLVGSRPIG